MRRRAIGVAIAFVVISIVAVYIYLSRKKPPDHALREVHVPNVEGAIKIDGELDEPLWGQAVRETFDDRPYSDIRLATGNGVLHVGLYASDLDIVTAHVPADGPVWRGDAFHFVITKNGKSFSFDVDPKCTLTDGTRSDRGAWNYGWQSGAKLACDVDGTIDVSGDNDEEWVVEMDIPLAAIGLEGKSGEHADLFVRRCDVNEAGGKPLETPCPETQFTMVF